MPGLPEHYHLIMLMNSEVIELCNCVRDLTIGLSDISLILNWLTLNYICKKNIQKTTVSARP